MILPASSILLPADVVEVALQDGGRTGAILIGRIPLMLRSDRCVLRGKSEEALARVGALPTVLRVPKQLSLACYFRENCYVCNIPSRWQLDASHVVLVSSGR